MKRRVATRLEMLMSGLLSSYAALFRQPEAMCDPWSGWRSPTCAARRQIPAGMRTAAQGASSASGRPLHPMIPAQCVVAMMSSSNPAPPWSIHVLVHTLVCFLLKLAARDLIDNITL